MCKHRGEAISTWLLGEYECVCVCVGVPERIVKSLSYGLPVFIPTVPVVRECAVHQAYGLWEVPSWRQPISRWRWISAPISHFRRMLSTQEPLESIELINHNDDRCFRLDQVPTWRLMMIFWPNHWWWWPKGYRVIHGKKSKTSQNDIPNKTNWIAVVIWSATCLPLQLQVTRKLYKKKVVSIRFVWKATLVHFFVISLSVSHFLTLYNNSIWKEEAIFFRKLHFTQWSDSREISPSQKIRLFTL